MCISFDHRDQGLRVGERLVGSGLARPRRKLASSARFRELLSQTPRLAFSRAMLARRVEIRSRGAFNWERDSNKVSWPKDDVRATDSGFPRVERFDSLLSGDVKFETQRVHGAHSSTRVRCFLLAAPLDAGFNETPDASPRPQGAGEDEC